MDQDRQVVLRVFLAIEERDPEALLALLHDDVELHDPESLPYGGVLRGKDALRERLESRPEGTWLGTWGPLQPTPAERRMDPRVVSSNDGVVVVAYHVRAISGTGERMDCPTVGVYEVRDGKFVRARMFHYDTAALVSFLERANPTALAGGPNHADD